MDVKLFIKGISSDQLGELQDSLIARRLVLDGEAQFRFPRGSKVYFDSGRRGWIYGTITCWKRAGKAEVLPDSGGTKWTVSGSLLRSR